MSNTAITGAALVAVLALAGCTSPPAPVEIAVPATERPASSSAATVASAQPAQPTVTPGPTGMAATKSDKPVDVAVARIPSNICEADQQVGSIIDSSGATHVVSGDAKTEATNVRLKPSMDSPVDCAIYNGVKVKALEVQGDWTKISYEWSYKVRRKTRTGWMWSDNLRKL